MKIQGREKFILSEADKLALNKYSPNLSQICEEAFESFGLYFKELKNKDGEFERKIVSDELSQKTLSKKTMKKLKDFASKTFHLADKDVLYSIFKELIDHQLRIVQYYRLYNKFVKLDNKAQKKLNKFIRLGNKKTKKILEKQLKRHDSDKLEDLTTAKHYISQQALQKIEGISPELKEALKIMAAALRRIHGDRNNHHNEYYNYIKESKWRITPYKVLEHVLDVSAIGDKKSEIPGEFYETKKDVCFPNFAKNFDKQITSTYETIRENKYFFKETTKLKRELAELKREKDADLAAIKKLEIKISDRTEAIVWQNLNDDLDETSKIIRHLTKNTYFAIEVNWDGDSKSKDKQLAHSKIISYYREKIFNKDIDLKDELKKTSRIIINKEEKLIKVSALLETLNQCNQLNREVEERTINSFKPADRRKLLAMREHIRRRNEEKGATFFVANPIGRV